MASNTTLNTGSGGDVIATKERTHDGDATKVQVVTLAGVTGTEGSYTFADIASGNGTAAASIRVTLASDSTGVLAATQSGTWNVGTVTTLTSITNAVTVVGSAAEDAAAAGNPVLIGGRYDSSARTLETGDVGALAVNASGHAMVEVASGSIAGIADDAAFTPGTSEVLPVGFTFDNSTPDSVDEGDIGAARMSANRCIFVNIRDNAGNERGLNIDASGQLATTVASLPASTNTIEVVGDAAHDAAVAGNPLLLGAYASSTAPSAVSTAGDAVRIWATLNGAAVTTNVVHAAAGGATPYKNLDCDETEDEIKATAGKLFWIHVMNLHASSVRYIKFYNATAANVTVGTTTPVLTFPVPSNIAGFTINFGDCGVQFDTAITVAATTGLADNDTGAPGANEVVLNAGYI